MSLLSARRVRDDWFDILQAIACSGALRKSQIGGS